jgi:SAM-dependent methyltransferase
MTLDWTSGYVTDVLYTTGYYPELGPLRARLPMLAAGYGPPRVAVACELGFGQGLSLAVHAATQPGVQWWGTDFNPDQAAYAEALLADVGVEARPFDQSFEEFCARDDLPQFDFIALHGTWSWVSDENRQVIVDFVRRKLRLGGVLYMSYNAQPAWAASIPLRHLMKLHADTMGAPGQGTVAKVGEAIAFIDRLFATGPGHLAANPAVAERLSAIKGQQPAYVAHEYMNRDWSPMAFSDVEAWLSPAKIAYACSAEILDQLALLQLKAEQVELLAEIPDRTLRETVRDFCVNRQFRRDYWLRGLRQLPQIEQHDRLRHERVVLTTPRAMVAGSVTGAQAKLTLEPGVYDPILDLLADHKPRSLEEIEQALQGRVAGGNLVTAIMVLMGQGSLASAQSDADIELATPTSRALNLKILDRSRGAGEISFLACPAIGGAVPAPRLQQMFLLASLSGLVQPAEWAAFAWSILKGQGQRMMRDGAPLLSDEENLATLTADAESFSAQVLPMWRSLGVI